MFYLYVYCVALLENLPYVSTRIQLLWLCITDMYLIHLQCVEIVQYNLKLIQAMTVVFIIDNTVPVSFPVQKSQ